jgi:ribosomal protein S18 acetylase RimI-like enzyme
MIIDSFEPITWFKKIDAAFGPLGGCDWRQRWEQRVEKVFAGQIILIGEAEGTVVAAATGTYDAGTRLGFVDILAVDTRFQGRGYGRLMLRGMLDHFRSLGAEHAHLECLSDNTKGNRLYASEGWTPLAESVKWFIRIT